METGTAQAAPPRQRRMELNESRAVIVERCKAIVDVCPYCARGYPLDEDWYHNTPFTNTVRRFGRWREVRQHFECQAASIYERWLKELDHGDS